MQKIEFANTDISAILDRIPDEHFNTLPFGLVKLDSQGTILAYNMAEASISGVRAEDVVGKNFFLDVAVCTQRPEFYGAFREAIDNDRVLNLIFDYEFQNALYAPVHTPVKVRVHMVSSRDTDGRRIVWLMVKRLAAAAGVQETNTPSPETKPSGVAAGVPAATDNLAAPGQHPKPTAGGTAPGTDELGDIVIRFDDL